MDRTDNLDLPYILPSQAQKHVTHNEALALLDAQVQLAVLDRGLSTPPGSPSAGARYIVASPGSGGWAGRDNAVAIFRDGAWFFVEPKPGWLAWVVDENRFVFWSGTEWSPVAATITELQNLGLLGIGTTADAANQFSAKLNKALWTAKTAGEGGDGDLRYTMNKEGAADVLSLLMQTGFSGRAELGLTGDDNFKLKVSADGSAWRDAIVVDRTTGKVRLPQTGMLTDFAVNLYQDSGRFAGNGLASVAAGAFAFPAYLALSNGTSRTGQGKFITNNNDYGGSAGALDAHVKGLVDFIRNAGMRRYGVEFWVANITMGTGTTTSVTAESQTFYASLLSAQTVRPPKLTFHAYIKALDDNILLLTYAGQTLYLNGVAAPGANTVLAPSAGWVSLTITDDTDPRTAFGYNPAFLNIYAKASGNRYLLACPALMGGITQVNDSVGVIAGANCWPA